MDESNHLFHLHGIDTASAELMLQLFEADAQALKLHSKNDFAQICDDEQLALNFQKEELKNVQVEAVDYCIALSMANAVAADGTIIQATRREDDQARNISGPPILSETILSKLAGSFMSERLGKEIENTNKKTENSANQEQEINASYLILCEICREARKYYDGITVACGHDYCKDCLRALFQASFMDETLFPPRCCRQNITVESVGIFLTGEIKHKFAEKKIEFETADRTYCSHSTCLAFIKPESINTTDNVATCAQCGHKTCHLCKKVAHENQDCPEDMNNEALVELAKNEQWQQCYNCQRFVELTTGCHHITCRCRAEFCYLCGAKWQTCRCALWNEDRLIQRGNVVADRNARAGVQGNPNDLVLDAIRELNDHENCTHTYCERVGGGAECELCGFWLRLFIFECRRCRIQICNRCRRNRI